jgi:hypothetical protein
MPRTWLWVKSLDPPVASALISAKCGAPVLMRQRFQLDLGFRLGCGFHLCSLQRHPHYSICDPRESTLMASSQHC